MSLVSKSMNGSWLLMASLVLASGCARRGSGPEVAESAYGGGGIQTSAIRAAPAAKQAANESRPLSELDTPEAIAARETATRNDPHKVAVIATAPKNSATAGTEKAPAAADAHQQMTTLQKGARMRVRSGALLHARPSLSGDSVPAVAAEFELGPQIYNAGGYWWYVTAGKESGWLLQTDIQR